MNIFAFILVVFILVLVHELGHFIAAKLNGIKVEEFGIGFPPSFIKVKYGETVYSLNLIPLGGYVRVYGEEGDVKKEKERAFVYKKPWQKLTVLVAGILGNFLLAWILISYLFTQGVPVPSNKVIIEKVVRGSPAYEAGLKKGDVVRAIIFKNKRIKVKNANEMVKIVNEYKGKKILLEIERGKKKFSVKVVPRKNPPKGQGALGVIITSYETKKYPWYEAPFKGLIESFKITQKVFTGIIKGILGFFTFKKTNLQVTGPIGIAKITSEAVKFGRNAFLELLALLSLNLAVVNILPFPALDGGRAVMVIYEWISGKRINKDFEQKLNLIGFALLILLAIIISIQDVKRFF